MYKKTVLLLFIFTINSFITFAQEEETILSAPDDWLSEIIHFPLGFAQEIDFVGFEDLRFAPRWNDSSSQEFWAYSFVWYIEKTSAMTEDKLTETFNLYYDGLMGVDENNKADDTTSTKLDKTLCLFIKTNDGFTGKMRVYDRFFTKDYLILNINVKETFCPKTNKQIILCDISPKDFSHEVWKIFDDVKVDIKCD